MSKPWQIEPEGGVPETIRELVLFASCALSYLLKDEIRAIWLGGLMHDPLISVFALQVVLSMFLRPKEGSLSQFPDTSVQRSSFKDFSVFLVP